MVAQPMQHLLVRARQALGWNQRGLGERLGSSHRTAVRWEGGHSHFSASYAAKLVKLVYPIDRDLAWEIATISGLTLIGLGLEAPPPAPEPPLVVVPPVPAASPPSATPAALGVLVDALVCTVADASDVAPKVIRPVVLLTLRRALALGLDLQAAEAAGLLESTAPAPLAPAGPVSREPG